MKDVMQKIGQIQDIQRTVDKLILTGEIIVKGNNIKGKSGDFERKHLYNNGCSIGLTTMKGKGGVFPEHSHKATQYIICFEGSCSVSIDGSTRFLEKGGCCAIPEGSIHRIINLEENTKIVDVCVPKEPFYSKTPEEENV